MKSLSRSLSYPNIEEEIAHTAFQKVFGKALTLLELICLVQVVMLRTLWRILLSSIQARVQGRCDMRRYPYRHQLRVETDSIWVARRSRMQDEWFDAALVSDFIKSESLLVKDAYVG